MHLDNYTAIAITASTASLFGLGVVIFAVLQKTFKGFVAMGLGFIGLGVGIALIALRGHIPDLVSIPLSNALLVASLFTLQEGLSLFVRGRGGYRKTAIASVLATFAVIHYFSAVVPSLRARIIALSMLFVIPLALCALTVARPIGQRRYVSQICTAALVWATMAIFLGRAVITVFVDPGTSYLSAGNAQTICIIAAMMSTIGYAFCNIWMSMQRYEDRLLELAEHDTLTGLYNRRALEERATQHLQTAERNARPLAIILFDVDNFKAINDTHGHQVGDQVLVELAKTVSNSLRSHDILARYGGEEFLILLPETMLPQAEKLAERLRLALKGIQLKANGQTVSVSASFGLCARQGSHATWDRLVSAADTALYEAKQSGKDTVHICTDMTPDH